MRTCTALSASVAMFVLGACVDASEPDQVNAPGVEQVEREVVTSLEEVDLDPALLAEWEAQSAQRIRPSNPSCEYRPCPDGYEAIPIGQYECEDPFCMYAPDQCPHERVGIFQTFTTVLMCVQRDYPWDIVTGYDHGRGRVQCGC